MTAGHNALRGSGPDQLLAPMESANKVPFCWRQMAEGAALAAGMPESLRTEIEQLLAQGRWFDATDRYREAAGTDPRTAIKVINAMATKK